MSCAMVRVALASQRGACFLVRCHAKLLACSTLLCASAGCSSQAAFVFLLSAPCGLPACFTHVVSSLHSITGDGQCLCPEAPEVYNPECKYVCSHRVLPDVLSVEVSLAECKFCCLQGTSREVTLSKVKVEPLAQKRVARMLLSAPPQHDC